MTARDSPRIAKAVIFGPTFYGEMWELMRLYDWRIITYISSFPGKERMRDVMWTPVNPCWRPQLWHCLDSLRIKTQPPCQSYQRGLTVHSWIHTPWSCGPWIHEHLVLYTFGFPTERTVAMESMKVYQLPIPCGFMQWIWNWHTFGLTAHFFFSFFFGAVSTKLWCASRKGASIPTAFPMLWTNHPFASDR